MYLCVSDSLRKGVNVCISVSVSVSLLLLTLSISLIDYGPQFECFIMLLFVFFCLAFKDHGGPCVFPVINKCYMFWHCFMFRIYRVNACLTVWFSFVFIEIKYSVDNFSCMQDGRVFYFVCASWWKF